MPEMTDPTPAMVSFEEALRNGQVGVRRCELDGDLYADADAVNGVQRFAYVRLDGATVTTFVNAALAPLVEGLPCFQFGCAVPVSFRRRGLATSTLKAAIAEMRNGFGRAGIEAFYVEGIVHVDNVPSRRVSERAISTDPVPVTDAPTGLPALQYLRKIETERLGRGST